MRQQLREFIQPRAANEQTARREFLLNITVLVMGVAAVLTALWSSVAFALGTRDLLDTAVLSAVTAIVCLAAYRLGRHGYVNTAGYVLSLLIWATASGLLLLGGWYTPAAVGYVLCVSLATLLNGLSGGIVIGIISLLAYGLIGWQFIGGAPPVYSLFPPADKLLSADIMILGITLVVVCALFYALDRQLMSTSLRRLHEMQVYADELEGVARERENLIYQLQKTTQIQEELLTTIREISAPVLPLFEGLIVMPVVGQLDRQRANLLFDDVMHGIAQYKADYILLDLTGVPMVDPDSATSLLQTIRGARMLGCECRLVGVQPGIAQGLTQLDVDLSEVGSYGTLREGLADLLQNRALLSFAGK